MCLDGLYFTTVDSEVVKDTGKHDHDNRILIKKRRQKGTLLKYEMPFSSPFVRVHAPDLLAPYMNVRPWG